VIATNGISWGYDFSAYFLAAHRLAAGAALYDPAQLSGTFPPQEQFAYLYPPFLAVALLPFSALGDFRAGMWIWAAIELFALIAATVVFARQRRLPNLVIVLLIGCELALAQVASELAIGNVHLILVGLFVLAWVGVERGDRAGAYGAGVAIGVATIIKVFPGVLILWLLLTRRFRAALAAIVTMGVLAAITLPWVGVGAWFDYVRVLANIGPPADVWSSIAPTTVLSELTGFTIARVIVLLLGLGVITWAAFRRPAPISFAIALMVSILIVPTLYAHSMSLAVAPLLIYAVYSVDWVGPVTAYVALFIGGQAALLNLQVAVNRLAAVSSLLVALVVFVVPWKPRAAAAPSVPSAGSH
jgi:alpha-1,2-mannosyltransferase